MKERRILIIAGSDSSGGAGLEADQRVIAAHQCYAMTATTALTVQNTLGVHDIHHVPSNTVRQQIDACFSDIGVDVVKIGMLASAETAAAVADAMKKHNPACLVVDPVMVSTSGSKLLPPEALHIMRERLLPLTTVLTPNIPEARLLLEEAGVNAPDPQEGETWHSLLCIARKLQKLGPKYVLLKGGHMPLEDDLSEASKDMAKATVLDILCLKNEVVLCKSRYRKSRNTHGTGCSLASAIASNLARGQSVKSAVFSSLQYVAAGIRSAPNIGQGNGPINHLHWSTFDPPFIKIASLGAELQIDADIEAFKVETVDLEG